MKKLHMYLIAIILTGCSTVQEKIKTPVSTDEIISTVKPLFSKKTPTKTTPSTQYTQQHNITPKPSKHKVTSKYCQYLPEKIKDLKASGECEVVKLSFQGKKGEEVSKTYTGNNKEITIYIKTGASAAEVNLLNYPPVKMQSSEFLREIKTCNGKKCGIDYDYTTSSGTVAILEDESTPVVITAEFQNISPKEAYEIVESIHVK